MPRFTLSQMLMGVALVAIGLLFTQAEGCGSRFAMIESMAFSSDDSRILVTKLTARDAQTPGKGYMADIARWVSWLDARNGYGLGVVRHDFAGGNRGPAFHMWWVGRATAICIPPNDQVAVLELGGGQVTCDVENKKPTAAPGHTGTNMVVSKSGRFIAASGNWEVSVLDTAANSLVMRVPSEDLPFLQGSLMAFSPDEQRLAVVSREGTCVWEIATSSKVATIVDKYEGSINSIVMAGETVVLGCDGCLLRYDTAGNLVKRLSDKGSGVCAISDDGRWLAVSGYQKVSVFDLSTNQLLREISLGEYAPSLALNSDGSKVAIGDRSGGVSMFDTKSGNRLWYVYPPGRYRWPWTVPLMFLAGWILIAWRLSKRRPTKDAA